MLDVSDLTVRFGTTTAVDGANLGVKDRTIHALMGPSGSGKSTMLRAIAGLEHPASGDIAWDGHSVGDVPTHRRGFGLMFQDYALFPHRTVGGNVAFGLQMQGIGAGTARSRVAEMLDLVGLPGYQDRIIGTLSGGEQQRVGIARAVVNKPPLLLADEPTGNLDPELSRDIMQLFEQFNQVGVSVLIASHDLDLISRLPYAQLQLHQGRLVKCKADNAT